VARSGLPNADGEANVVFGGFWRRRSEQSRTLRSRRLRGGIIPPRIGVKTAQHLDAIFTGKPRIRHSAFTLTGAISLLSQGSGGKPAMADLLYVVLALATFALFALAVDACERL
jgi:hypothetical protein